MYEKFAYSFRFQEFNQICMAQDLIAATPEAIEIHITVLKYPHENESKLKAYILLAYELF